MLFFLIFKKIKLTNITIQKHQQKPKKKKKKLIKKNIQEKISFNPILIEKKYTYSSNLFKHKYVIRCLRQYFSRRLQSS